MEGCGSVQAPTPPHTETVGSLKTALTSLTGVTPVHAKELLKDGSVNIKLSTMGNMSDTRCANVGTAVGAGSSFSSTGVKVL